MDILQLQAQISDQVFHTLGPKIGELILILNEAKVDAGTTALAKLIYESLGEFKVHKETELVMTKKVDNPAESVIIHKVQASLQRQIKNIESLQDIILNSCKNPSGEIISAINALRQHIHDDIEMQKRILEHVPA